MMKGRRSRFKTLLKQPFFWSLTIGGNALVFVGSLLLYYFEGGLNGNPTEYIDYLLWSTGTVTTIGYGNFTPIGLPGKLTLLALMVLGTLFVWSYMAFLVTGLMAPELNSLEKDVHDVEKELQDLKLGSK